MLEKALLIVSDKFHTFATRKDVITKSELYHLLNADDVLLPQSKKIRLIPGQGFSQTIIDEIITMTKTSKNAHFFDFSLWYEIPKRANKKLTHKHMEENILVSEPKRTSENEFIMDILIDENCEMMRDHQTGLHVQGMLLVEAARQAYLAMMEKFFMTEEQGKYYFIFNNLNVDYNRFSFPLPSSIRLTNKKIETFNKKRTDTLTVLELLQCGDVSASVTMDVTIMPESRVANMENRLATQSVNNYMNSMQLNTANYIDYKEANNA